MSRVPRVGLYERSGLGCQTYRVDDAPTRPSDALRKPRPGRLFRVVKVASWIELGLFAILLVVWLAPGMEHQTFVAGMAHGIGFIALALLIWLAVLRHEAPYTLLAATLTPAGPVGSVIAIEWIERRSSETADEALTGPSARGSLPIAVDTARGGGQNGSTRAGSGVNQ
jgi:hypothetical protein